MDTIDTALVKLAVDGDQKALERILRQLERPFLNLAIRMGLGADEAEDAAQESLVRVATRLAQFEGRAKFSTWAWKVAVGRILDVRYRREARISFATHASSLAQGLDPTAPEQPDDSVEIGELKMRCDRALLLCLDADHRVAFVLGAILEIDSNEASAIVEITPAAFRQRLSRARAELQSALTSSCGIVNPGAACRCHRRLSEARRLGRCAPGVVSTDAPLDVVQLRTQIARVSEALRAEAYYRADPSTTPRRDLVRAAIAPLTY
jgi:RNA polymerase sigma factor (sigma-70 family)